MEYMAAVCMNLYIFCSYSGSVLCLHFSVGKRVQMQQSESQTCVELPVLDISKPLDTSSMCSLTEACKTWGFFLVSNHGISRELYGRVYMLSKHLFNLPSDTKLELGPLSSSNSYTPHFIASPFFESLRISGPNFFASAESSANFLFNQQSTFEFR